MWVYEHVSNDANRWPLGALAQRVNAAAQLGYDVRLRTNDDSIIVEYVERPGSLDI
jgi:hypothetical protein